MRAILRREPSLGNLREQIDGLFGEFLGDFPSLSAWQPFRMHTFPAVNVCEGDDDMYVEAELPGVSGEDVELSVAGSELTIKGQRPRPEPAAGVTIRRRERRFGPFHRVVRLPVAVDEGRIEATLRDGLLAVTLRKAATSRPRRVKVETVST